MHGPSSVQIPSPTIENRTPRTTLKTHANKRQSTANLYRYTRRTLGGAGIRQAVHLPPGERLCDWLATNSIDFYQVICLLVGIVSPSDENDQVILEPGRGFPPGFEYLWADTVAKRTIKCNGPQYIELVLNWVQSVINDKHVFPTSTYSTTAYHRPTTSHHPHQQYPSSPSPPPPPPPRDFEKTCKGIFKRLFRVFAILYTHHYQRMESMGAVAHLNTTFKHFMFFCFEFDLVPAAELEAIDLVVQRLREEYQRGEPPQSSSAPSSASASSSSPSPSSSSSSGAAAPPPPPPPPPSPATTITASTTSASSPSPATKKRISPVATTTGGK